jgi:hypothetical protein
VRTRVVGLISEGASRDVSIRTVETDYGWRATGCQPAPPRSGCLQYQQIHAMLAELR